MRWQSKEIHFGNNVVVVVVAPTSRISRAFADSKSELIKQPASGASLTVATTTSRAAGDDDNSILFGQIQMHPSAPTQSLFKPNWQLLLQTRFNSLFSRLTASSFNPSIWPESQTSAIVSMLWLLRAIVAKPRRTEIQIHLSACKIIKSQQD